MHYYSCLLYERFLFLIIFFCISLKVKWKCLNLQSQWLLTDIFSLCVYVCCVFHRRNIRFGTNLLFSPRHLSYWNLPFFPFRQYRSVLQPLTLSFSSSRCLTICHRSFTLEFLSLLILLYLWSSFWCWPSLWPLNTRPLQLLTSSDCRVDRTVCWLLSLFFPERFSC